MGHWFIAHVIIAEWTMLDSSSWERPMEILREILVRGRLSVRAAILEITYNMGNI